MKARADDVSDAKDKRAEHTLGEWQIDECTADGHTPYPRLLIGTPDEVIACLSLTGKGNHPDPETQRANAKVMMAAPALLKALRDLVEFGDDNSMISDDTPCFEVARKALALVDGEGA